MPKFHIAKETAEYVFIIDDYSPESPSVSVTNNPEDVLKALACGRTLESQRVFYMDTDGQIDELLHKKDEFTGYKAGHDGVELP